MLKCSLYACNLVIDVLCRDLSDLDKDGRLSCDEYIIAMHLMACVKGGASLPTTLPADLYPGPTKFQTVDRLASKAAKPPLERKVATCHKYGRRVCITSFCGGGGRRMGTHPFLLFPLPLQ